MIDSFRGRYGFLSNFFREKDGLTVEHRYQAMKAADPKARSPFPPHLSPGQAKAQGRRIPIRPDWERVKDRIMEDLVWAKFVGDKVLAAELLATGDEELVEGNTWRDVEWGMVKGPDGSWYGKNKLGKILMKVRAKLAGGLKP